MFWKNLKTFKYTRCQMHGANVWDVFELSGTVEHGERCYFQLMV